MPAREYVVADLQARATWSDAFAVFARSQPLTWPMLALFAIMPFYLFLPGLALKGRTMHSPVLPLDALFPLSAPWSIVYASLFLAAILPVFVVHQPVLLNRTVLAYLGAWLVSLAAFVAYPTIAPAHPAAAGGGFFDWGLLIIWGSDVPYNCFPSLHVAQCFLAALACSRVHAGVGRFGLVWASLVALSTLYTKQHYVADVLGGIVVAGIGHVLFLRGFPREATPEHERRLAPRLATAAFGLYAVILLVFVSVWLVSAQSPIG